MGTVFFLAEDQSSARRKGWILTTFLWKSFPVLPWSLTSSPICAEFQHFWFPFQTRMKTKVQKTKVQTLQETKDFFHLVILHQFNWIVFKLIKPVQHSHTHSVLSLPQTLQCFFHCGWTWRHGDVEKNLCSSHFPTTTFVKGSGSTRVSPCSFFHKSHPNACFFPPWGWGNCLSNSPVVWSFLFRLLLLPVTGVPSYFSSPV